jgi:NAD+--asparagine ADP-ribosyltransferase
MPIKYTYAQVQDIFNQNKCILVSQKYENQLGKLEYVASCGHIHNINLKEFINGIGKKCRNCALEIPTYEDVFKKFTEKNCIVTMTKEEFIENYKNNNCKIKYNASCGHENNVSYKNFTTLNQGINCPKCVNKNVSCKLKDLYSNDNKLSSLQQELKCINYIKELINWFYSDRKSIPEHIKINYSIITGEYNADVLQTQDLHIITDTIDRISRKLDQNEKHIKILHDELKLIETKENMIDNFDNMMLCP